MTQSPDVNKADIFCMTTDLTMWCAPKPLLQYVAQKMKPFLTKAFQRYTAVYTGTRSCYMKAVGLNHTKAKPITGPEGRATRCLVPLF